MNRSHLGTYRAGMVIACPYSLENARAVGDGRSDGDRRRGWFRIRSYRNGATAVEGYPERIADILATRNARSPTFPASAKGWRWCWARSSIHGSCERRDLLLQKFPPTTLEFLKIQGLGPKSIALILEHYRISTMDELERLAKRKSCACCRAWAPSWKRRCCAPSRNTAAQRPLPAELRGDHGRGAGRPILRGPGVEAVTPAGSLRRGRETVGDLDLLVTGPDATPRSIASWPIRAWKKCWARREQGQRQGGPRGIAGGRARAAAGDSFGAAMQYFTGSKDHNVAMRTRAVKMG
jgi:DNA polymerase (family X)